MKRILLLVLTIVSISATAQITTYYPPRTPATGQPAKIIADKYFRALKSMWIPYTNSTTPNLNATIDSVGNGFQMLSNGSLVASKGLGTGYFYYPALPVMGSALQYVRVNSGGTALEYATLSVATPTLQQVLTAGKDATLGATFVNNIGVGNTNPLSTIHITHGDAGSTDSKGIRLENTAVNKSWLISAGEQGVANSSFGIKDITLNAYRFVINTSGVVRIPNLTASRAVATDASSNLISSAVTGTELGYLSGVTSAIQTQLNDRVNLTSAQTVAGSKQFTDILSSGNVNVQGQFNANPSTDARAGVVVTANSPTTVGSLFWGRTSAGATVFTVSPSGIVTGSQFVRSGGTSSQFLKADGSVDATNYNQTLSLGATPGNIAISSGNNVSLPTLTMPAAYTGDANSSTLYANAGFFPYLNNSGSANYPSSAGAGFRIVRGAATTDRLLEMNVTAGATDSLIYFRKGLGSGAYSPWMAIASRAYVASQIPVVGSFSGVASSTTAFIVTIGQTMSNTTYKVNITPTTSIGVAPYYISAKTTTTFTVTYLTGLTGTLTFDWAVFR